MTVSYTHLDVYKRQDSEGERFFILPEALSVELRIFATIRAVEVLPVPLGPANRNACGIDSA